jgi:hypothetical protein
MRELTSKKVKRYFASYTNTSGEFSRKSFGSKMAACRFLAKQDLLDLVFGPKDEVEDYHGNCFWKRDTPNEKEDRAKVWAEHFPLEECECGLPKYFCPEPEPNKCEEVGYARCQVKQWLDSVAQDYYWGRKGSPSRE